MTRPKILVVDDDPRNVDILAHILEDVAEIQTAASGEECLEKRKTFNPDLILLDIMMPGMNGYEACKRIKSEKEAPKVILVSAKAMLEERLQGYEVGADDYIAKPFDHEEMVAKVRVFLKLKSAEDDLLALNMSLESLVWARTEQLIRAERDARVGKNEVDNIIKSMGDSLIVLDLDLKISRVNRATCATLGFDENDLLGKSIGRYFESEGAFEESGLVSFLQKEKLANSEFTLVSKTGETIPMLVSASTVKDENEVVTGIVCLGKDMRERRKAEAERELMQRQVLQSSKLASIGELAAGVAHEINNPLTIIKGNLDYLHELFEQGSNQEMLTIVKQQEGAIERIVNIVNGLRVYARMDTGEMSQLNVHSVLDQSISIIQHIYRKQNISIEKELNAPVPFVKGNSGRLQQVIINLLSNARDAVEGVAEPRIRIQTSAANGQLTIRVSDNGSGMDKKTQERIFEPFYTTKEAGKGTGLGLSIAMSIVQEIGGRMEVQSEKGKGTTFSIVLPVLDAKEVFTQPTLPMKKAEKTSKYDGKALVVDDETDICDIVARYLTDMGFEVEMANDGAAALEKVKGKHFDLIITDMKMPKMCGDVFITEARKIGIEGTKVVAITGSPGMADSGERIERFRDVSDALVRKPFSRKDIHEAVKSALNPIEEAAA